MMQNNELPPPKKRPRASNNPEDVQPPSMKQMKRMPMPNLHGIQMHQPPQIHKPIAFHLVSSTENGSCARQLRQYMHHQRKQPNDNCISHWRKFVKKYFAPGARKRWCFSSYDNARNHGRESLLKASADAWQCGICCSKSGKGYEATYEILPRLNQVKFDHDIIDELWHLDMVNEIRLSSGMMVLEYAKAVQESFHQDLRVIREGHLRIIFTQDLKIISWEFCVRKHEELLPHRAVVNQVKQLLHCAQNYNNVVVNESDSSEVSVQDLHTKWNKFEAAGCRMERSIDLQSFNSLGFSKSYVRCLQVSELFNSMKDLIDFSWSNKTGPIESLKNYTKEVVANKVFLFTNVATNILTEQPKYQSSTTCFPHNNFSQAAGPSNTCMGNISNPIENPTPPNPSIGFKHAQPMQIQGSNPSIVMDPSFEHEQPVQFQGNYPSIVGGQTIHDITIPNNEALKQSVSAPNTKEIVRVKIAGNAITNSVVPNASDASSNLKPVPINSIFCDSCRSYDAMHDSFRHTDIDYLCHDSTEEFDIFK